MTRTISDVEAGYASTREAIHAALLPQSPLAAAVRRWLTDRPLPPSVLLPMAAAGGVVPASTALSASLGFLLLTTRWLDDLVDRDREGQLWQEYGVGGAAVLASSALTHAWACMAREPGVPRDVLTAFGDTTAVLAMGEHEDFRKLPRSAEAWQRVAWRKTAVSYRFALWAGARLTGDSDWEQQSTVYGEHLGLYLQAVDDIAGTFDVGTPDLKRGRTFTLPLVLLLEEKPDAEEAFRRRDARTVAEALDARGVRERCEALAAAYAGEARSALERCPGPWTWALDGLLGALCGADCTYAVTREVTS
jgi:geranylgeranyl pyrophosphate synthase